MRRHVRVLIAVGVIALMAAVFLTAAKQSRPWLESVKLAQAPVPGMMPGAGGPPPGMGGPPGMPGGGPPGAAGAPPPGGPSDSVSSLSGGGEETSVAREKRAGPGAAEAAPAPVNGRKVVMTATLSLEVKEFAKVTDQIAAAARKLGGYVGQSEVQLPTEGIQQGSVTIRVPQERYQEAMDRLKSFGKVVGEAQSAEDVTERYVDLDARTRNLRAEEERILDIMRRARTMKETLLVEERLTDIRGRLETLEGQLRYLKYQVAMATITVTLMEKATVLHFAEPQWVWWNEVTGAWHSAVGLAQALVTVLTYVGVFGVFWVPILGLVLWAAKRRPKKSDVPPGSE